MDTNFLTLAVARTFEDPNLFHLDWERTFEVLATIVVLAFFVERALSVVFEHRLFVQRASKKGAKEFIAFGVALALCFFWDFDAVSIVVLREETSFLGKFLTAGVIAGGSKAAVKLFRDLMDFKSTAYREAEAAEIKAARPRRAAAKTGGKAAGE